VDPKQKIDYYLNIFKEIIRIENNTINISLAGDSTNIAKNISVINFSFGFLDEIRRNKPEETNPNMATGNFSLIIKSKFYEDLRKALTELIDLLSAIEATEIDGKIYDIVFWLGRDLKFLALALGKNNFLIICVNKIYVVSISRHFMTLMRNILAYIA